MSQRDEEVVAESDKYVEHLSPMGHMGSNCTCSVEDMPPFSPAGNKVGMANLWIRWILKED